MEIIMFNSGFSQPEDKGIFLKDIIEIGEVTGHTLSEKAMARIERKNYSDPQIMPEKTGTINTKNNSGQLSIDKGTTLIPLRPCELRDTQPADNALCHHVATATDIKANEANKRIYADTGKSPTVTTMGGGHREPKVLVVDKKYRKLTPKECMRLQGFTEEIINKLLNAGISNSQLYKMTGNSFTLPVIIHNLQCLLDTGWPDNQ